MSIREEGPFIVGLLFSVFTAIIVTLCGILAFKCGNFRGRLDHKNCCGPKDHEKETL